MAMRSLVMIISVRRDFQCENAQDRSDDFICVDLSRKGCFEMYPLFVNSSKKPYQAYYIPGESRLFQIFVSLELPRTQGVAGSIPTKETEICAIFILP